MSFELVLREKELPDENKQWLNSVIEEDGDNSAISEEEEEEANNNAQKQRPRPPPPQQQALIIVKPDDNSMTVKKNGEEDVQESEGGGEKVRKKKFNGINVKALDYIGESIRRHLLMAVVALSIHAAKHPYWYILLIVPVSLSLVGSGFYTNFNLNLNHEELFTPESSLSEKHRDWIVNFNPYRSSVGQHPQRRQEQLRGVLMEKNNFRHESLWTEKMMNKDSEEMNHFLDDHEFGSSSTNFNHESLWTEIMMNNDNEEMNHFLDDNEFGSSSTNFNHESLRTEMMTNNDSEEMNHFLDDHEFSSSSSSRRKTLSMVNGNNIITILIHANGKNILGKEGVSTLFDAIETIQDSSFACPCGTYGATTFWRHDKSTFEEEVHSDEDIIATFSRSFYPDNTPVDLPFIAGNARRLNRTVVYAESLTAHLTFRTRGEKDAIKNILQYRDQLAQRTDNILRVEVFTIGSYENEFLRAIIEDLPLVPVVGLIMVAFTCLVFFRWDRVNSKCLLGLGSVITICLSIMSGYGLMFLCGIPFTPMTTLLPFLVFGIGLDDTFIITGAYSRTDENKDPVDRIRETMEEIGLSISVTTITTTVAFALGMISTIPSISWLCLYAFPTIIIDFLYQITFFVALVVLDSRRIQANRTDGCTCFLAVAPSSNNEQKPVVHPVDHFMRWYSTQLLRPWTRRLALFTFVAYLAICIYQTTLMKQEFKVSDLVPQDSYIRDFVKAYNKYSTRVIGAVVYFRNVDQSDEKIQQQMVDYIDDLVAIEAFGEQPPFCWVRDFRTVIQADQSLHELPFNEQIDRLLSIPLIRQVYGHQLIRDFNGNVAASRCLLWFNNLDPDDVSAQVDALRQQRAVSAAQPVNINADGQQNWPFFTYEEVYLIWEFFDAAVRELISTTVSAVIAVSAVTLVIVPHWSAILFVLPMVTVLYIDLIGTLQFVGVRINAVSYVALVISIGLMVDFILHILIKYYESTGKTRDDKVKEALSTIGSSILLGGLSTFLGTVPLLFSTSEIFTTIFDAIFAMITLSIAHGLILLPVLLSFWGPTKSVGLKIKNSFND